MNEKIKTIFTVIFNIICILIFIAACIFAGVKLASISSQTDELGRMERERVELDRKYAEQQRALTSLIRDIGSELGEQGKLINSVGSGLSKINSGLQSIKTELRQDQERLRESQRIRLENERNLSALAELIRAVPDPSQSGNKPASNK